MPEGCIHLGCCKNKCIEVIMYTKTQLILYLLHQSAIAKVKQLRPVISQQRFGPWQPNGYRFHSDKQQPTPLTCASKENHIALPWETAKYPQTTDLFNKTLVIRIRIVSAELYLGASGQSIVQYQSQVQRRQIKNRL